MNQYYDKIDAEIAKTILADHYDVYFRKVNPDSRTIDGHDELDSMKYASYLEGASAFPAGGNCGRYRS